MDSNNAIELRDIHLKYTYDVYDSGEKGFFNINTKKKGENHVLDGLNLDVKKGEILGIVGTNGAGKSTLLSIIARILDPDSGSVEINGKVATILELGMGFHSDLTGRENIILKGELYGFSKKEMEAKAQDIIDYSGIGRYIDNPVRTYSSGMRSRLAFSIMIHVDAEIMLVDEILSTGDATFSAKAADFFKKLLKDGKTVVFVSHSAGSVESICTRVIWLDKGKIVADGKPKKVVAMYQEATLESIEVITDQANSGLSEAQYNLSQCYKDGNKVEANEEAYRYWLELAAEQGHLKAQVELADLLMASDDENDHETAMKYYQSSAARGDTNARIRLSQLIGMGGTTDLEKINAVFRYYAERGNPTDILRYANFLLKTAWNDKQRAEAFTWFKRLADDYNHPDAIVQLANMYSSGIGVKRNRKLYLETIKKGAWLGIPKTSQLLADEYVKGSLVEEDLEKALQLYEFCANNGVASSQYAVAMMYLEGKGTEINQEKARYWFDMYSKSQITPYQLSAIELSKQQTIPGAAGIDEFYEMIKESKDPKALIELSNYLNNMVDSSFDDSITQRIDDINEQLSKSYGKGMDIAFNYYSRQDSKGYNPQKALEIGLKSIYQGKPDTLYKVSLLCLNSEDESLRELGRSCLILSAKSDNALAINACLKNGIDYDKESIKVSIDSKLLEKEAQRTADKNIKQTSKNYTDDQVIVEGIILDESKTMEQPSIIDSNNAASSQPTVGLEAVVSINESKSVESNQSDVNTIEEESRNNVESKQRPIDNGNTANFGQLYRYQNGSSYWGKLDENGLFTGFGAFTYPNGDRFEGEHIAGVRNGNGCFFWRDGSWSKGSYFNGIRQGPTTLYTSNDGRTYEGNMVNDHFIGNIRISGEGRLIYEGGCRDMRPSGEGVMYFKNGRIIGQWSPNGRCKGIFYSNDGTKTQVDPRRRFI
ncbi:MAG: ATP-binding cassette domain-containing protein [Candidatus Methanomethylophilaceae archaeon]|nr:ATP-binding cassette domain-containing protein [Candidatus Methanomethylophilaceae archaeon]